MAPLYSFLIFLAIIHLSSLFITSCDARLIKRCPFNAIYSFGVRDSSPGSHLLIDELASSFHLPSPKPYSHQQYHQLSYGATFATENAMVLSKRFLREHDIQVPSDSFSTDSITSQPVSFGSYLPLVCNSDRLQCRQILGRALFVVDLGSNDYKYAFSSGESIVQVGEHYTPLIVDNIIDMLSEIRKAGVSNIIFPGMLTLGCFPGYISLLNDTNPAALDIDDCHTGLNIFAKNHNHHLKRAISHAWSDGQPLSELEDNVSYSQVLFTDYCNAFMDLLRDKSNNPTVLCREDGFHLSEEANKYIVEKVISGNNFILPEIRLPNVNHCVM